MSDDHKSPADVSEPLPAYEATSGPFHNPAEPALAPEVVTPFNDPASAPEVVTAASRQGPTIASPFDFPDDSPAPAYTSTATGTRRPIAIPQTSPDATASFLPAYAPTLLGRGIPPGTWASFLDTASAFLTAKVGDRAVSHAADMARHVGDVPVRFGKSVAEHAKSVGRSIGHNARRGNVLDAAMGVVGGAISLPVVTAVGAVDAVIRLPSSAIAAATQKPKTPRAHAEVYAAAANKDWLHARGLHATLVDTRELAAFVGAPGPREFLEPAFASKDTAAEVQVRALGSHIDGLEVRTKDGSLRLTDATLWFVVTEWHEQSAPAKKS
jgi:hypothetical protein